MSDGGKTNHYNIENCIDIDDVAEHLELRADEFNSMKAIFGIAIERKLGKSRHDGTGSVRDANKLLHYAKRINKRVKNENNLQ